MGGPGVGPQVPWSPGLCTGMLFLWPHVLPLERMGEAPSQCGPPEVGALDLKVPSAPPCLPVILCPVVLPALVLVSAAPARVLLLLFLPPQVVLHNCPPSNPPPASPPCRSGMWVIVWWAGWSAPRRRAKRHPRFLPAGLGEGRTQVMLGTAPGLPWGDTTPTPSQLPGCGYSWLLP